MRSLVVLLVAAVVGCAVRADPVSPDSHTPAVSVYVTDSEFVLPPAGYVVASAVVANTGPGSAFLASCDDRPLLTVERWGGSGWQQYGSGRCLATYSMMQRDLAEQTMAEGLTSAISDAGRYRLRAQFGVRRNDGAPNVVYSKEFTVR